MSIVQPITGRQAGELCRLLEERSVGGEEFQKKLIERVNDLVCWIKGDQGIVYPITVDYNQSFEQMVKAGCYDWVDSDITAEHFPVKGVGLVQLDGQLICFDKSMSSEQILAELDKMGLRSGNVEELLAFGTKYPDRQFPVIEPASSWQDSDGYRLVVYLDSHARERDLSLDWFESGWDDYYRFLAFRKYLISN